MNLRRSYLLRIKKKFRQERHTQSNLSKISLLRYRIFVSSDHRLENIAQCLYSKTCPKRPLKIDKTKLTDKRSKVLHMLQWEHTAILLTCIKRYSV